MHGFAQVRNSFSRWSSLFLLPDNCVKLPEFVLLAA